MEVTRHDFTKNLPTILKHISEAHFVAFDLELSGIPDQRRNRRQGPKTLADRYKEVKEASETYHILQVGLTCVEEEASRAGYVLRSFNFNISPLIDEQLDLERLFTYSTGAVDFLLRHDYKMDSPFVNGIPYLTRAETPLAMENALARWDRQSIPDIKIRTDDTKALSFMKRVREEIQEWQKYTPPQREALDILGVAETKDGKTSVVPLNRFEKRLVHQLVRAEFPTLQTFSRTDGVQVQPLNQEEQRRSQESLHRRLKSTIFDQVGFRWVSEAMGSGDLSGLDREALKSFPNGSSSQLDSIIKRLEVGKKVLIGHNCLLDLVYFFRTFYGPLPDTIDEFSQQVHEIFPLVIDTKYLSTNPGSTDALRFRNSQLSQIDEALAEQQIPEINCGSGNNSYEDTKQYHEAGFDSFVTAKVFLRLATKIADEHPDQWPSAKSVVAEQTKSRQRKNKKASVKDDSDVEQMASVSSNKFFHQNIFAGLDSVKDDEDSASSEADSSFASKNAMQHHSQPEDPRDVAQSLQGLRLMDGDDHSSVPGLIPRWNTQFWSTFGNKIRVYGTSEELFDLNPPSLHKRIETEISALVVEPDPKNGDNRQRSVFSDLREAVGKLF